jgi:predicted XRE-type DNA-binding protein
MTATTPTWPNWKRGTTNDHHLGRGQAPRGGDRRAAGHPVRTGAERTTARRRLDDEIRAFRLAEVRRNRALTQREVADAMGVSGPRASDVERGKLDTVSVSGPRASDVERGKLDTVSVSGLRVYVEALGGRLKVTAEFDDSTSLVA